MLNLSSKQKICIRILGWEEFAGTSRAPFYFKLPMTLLHQWELDPYDKGIMVSLLAAAGASRRGPGVIYKTPLELSKELQVRAKSLLPALHRLAEAQLIQLDTNFDAAMYRREIEREEKKREGFSLFPAWVSEKAGMRIYAAQPNRFLTMEVFVTNIARQYPKQDPEPLERVYRHLEKFVYDEAWVLFIQSCFRNYERRKKAAAKSPIWHSMDKYFLEREWWMDFLTDNSQVPTDLVTVARGVRPAAGGELPSTEQNIIYQVSQDGGESVKPADTIARIEALKATLTTKSL